MDSSIAFKFGTKFYYTTGDRDTLQMFTVKGQRSMSQGQSSRSRCKMPYEQQKRYTAMDRFSDFKLGMVS